MDRDPALPPTLASRPRTSSGLPIPYVAGRHADGTADFTVIDAERSLEAARRRWCALCGSGLGYWLAFLGGPQSALARTFVDGPAHEDCLLAAVRLCPYLARRASRRSSRQPDGTLTPQGFDERKPTQFAIGVTRSYRTFIDASGAIVHKAAPFVRMRTFSYVDDVLVEQARTPTDP